MIARATTNMIAATMIAMAALLSLSSTFGLYLTTYVPVNEVLPLWTVIFAFSFLAILSVARCGFFVRLSPQETLGSARPDVTPLTSQ